MNVVFIVPTGIGAEIGGHAGDATPALRMIASICDKVITHPNVVNASDINEMPENCLYVEGSMLDRLLEGQIALTEVKSNKILLMVNSPIASETINAVNAMRANLGIKIEIAKLDTPLMMKGFVDKDTGKAGGLSNGVKELINQVKRYSFDALGVATQINVDEGIALKYFREGGVNPWGGIEAIVSKEISLKINKPVAHAPIESEGTKENLELFSLPYNEIVDPRMAAEAIGVSYLCCILKGLHKAPKILPHYSPRQISSVDIDALIAPYDCVGPAHLACEKSGIPIIQVLENKVIKLNENNKKSVRMFTVENYWEAAGIIACIKSGVSPETVRRPLSSVSI